jgi:hypothetical protein
VTDPFERWFAADVDESALSGLAVLADLRRALAARGLGEAVTLVDEHAEALIALYADPDDDGEG